MKRQLSQSERSVLFALTEDGTRTDSEVAERVGMKESTVGTHRRSLIKNGHIHFVNYPAFHKLGCEFLVEFFGRTNPAIPLDDKNEIYTRFFKRNPQIFDAVSGEGFLMASAAFTKIADLLNFSERHDIFFESLPTSKGLLEAAIFPFEISRCSYLYNFAPCLHRILRVNASDPDGVKPKWHRMESPELSKMEAQALLEMLEFPNATDAEIASRTRRSRQSVTAVRNAFIEQGLLVRTAVPTLTSVEFGAVAYVHLKFKPATTLEKKNSIAGDDWWKQSCYTLERNSELFAVYPFASFKEYSSLMGEYIGPFERSGVLAQHPEIFVVSTENLVDLVDCAFAPLVKRILT